MPFGVCRSSAFLALQHHVSLECGVTFCQLIVSQRLSFRVCLWFHNAAVGRLAYPTQFRSGIDRYVATSLQERANPIFLVVNFAAITEKRLSLEASAVPYTCALRDL